MFDTTEDKLKITGLALTFGGTIFASIVSWGNSASTNGIAEIQNRMAAEQASNSHSIEIIKTELSARNQDLSRFRFVSELLPEALEGDNARSASFLALVQLTLTEEEFRNLAGAFSGSADVGLRDIGDQASAQIQRQNVLAAENILRLIKSLSSSDRLVRVAAVEEIRRQYHASTTMAEALLDYLQSGRTERLDENGRVNSLVALRGLSLGIFDQPLKQRASVALLATEEGASDPDVGPPLGSTSSPLISDIRFKLGLDDG